MLSLASDEAAPIAGDILEASILRADRHARARQKRQERAEQDALLARLRREMGMF